MKTKTVVLSIAVALSAGRGYPDGLSPDGSAPLSGEQEKESLVTAVEVRDAEEGDHAGGRCAAGKCGGGSRFDEVTLSSDRTGVISYARDGNCGLTASRSASVGEGDGASSGQFTEGVCAP